MCLKDLLLGALILKVSLACQTCLLPCKAQTLRGIYSYVPYLRGIGQNLPLKITDSPFSHQSGTIYALLSSPQVAVPSAPTVSGSGICVPPGIYCPGLEKGSPPAQRSCGSAESPCGEKRDPQTSWLWWSLMQSRSLHKSPGFLGEASSLCIYRDELFDCEKVKEQSSWFGLEWGWRMMKQRTRWRDRLLKSQGEKDLD